MCSRRCRAAVLTGSESYDGSALQKASEHAGIAEVYEQGSLALRPAPRIKTSTSSTTASGSERDRMTSSHGPVADTKLPRHRFLTESSEVRPSSDVFGQERPVIMERPKSGTAARGNDPSDATRMVEHYQEVSRHWKAKGKILTAYRQDVEGKQFGRMHVNVCQEIQQDFSMAQTPRILPGAILH